MSNKTMVQRTLFRFSASWVKRFHTHSSINPEHLGQHSHTVAMIVTQVHPCCSKSLILAALEHDLPEFVTGDTPAPAKWESPDLDEALGGLEARVMKEWGLYHPGDLVPHERMLLKWADMAALVLFCHKEVSMGNSTMQYTLDTGFKVMLERAGAMLKQASTSNDPSMKLMAAQAMDFSTELHETLKGYKHDQQT